MLRQAGETSELSRKQSRAIPRHPRPDIPTPHIPAPNAALRPQPKESPPPSPLPFPRAKERTQARPRQLLPRVTHRPPMHRVRRRCTHRSDVMPCPRRSSSRMCAHVHAECGHEGLTCGSSMQSVCANLRGARRAKRGRPSAGGTSRRYVPTLPCRNGKTPNSRGKSDVSGLSLGVRRSLFAVGCSVECMCESPRRTPRKARPAVGRGHVSEIRAYFLGRPL